METSKHFDEQIKKAMLGLEAEPDTGAWDAFEQKLADAEMADADELLRQRLGGMEVMAPTGSWAAMEQIIEADEAAEIIEQEVGIDNLVHEKLAHLEVPFQSKHWAIMARRLEEEFMLHKQIYQYKISEIALVALILLTFVRFLPFAEDIYRPAAENYHQEIQPSEQPSEQPIFFENENEEENTDEVLGTPIAAASAEIDSGLEKNIARNNSGETGAALFSENIPSISENNNSPIFSKNNSPLIKNIKGIGLAPISSIYEVKSPVDIFLENYNRQQKIWAAKQSATPKKLAVLNAKKVKPGYAWEELPSVKTGGFIKKKELRFSIFTSNDINYVTTPADKLNVFDVTVSTDEHKTMAAGYGGGILMSWKRGKTEYQTGGIYSFKRYMPNTPVFLFKTLNYYVKEDFNGIQLDILQVPLNVNYHFKDRGNWRFYSSTGVAGNFVTSSVYEIETEEHELYRDPLGPPSGPDDLRSIRTEKEFPDGIADGGKLDDNLYISLNAGIGVERYLSPNWVVFFQPQYQHFIYTKGAGIGTNNDKIYTTSFYLGTKFNLK